MLLQIVNEEYQCIKEFFPPNLENSWIKKSNGWNHCLSSFLLISNLNSLDSSKYWTMKLIFAPRRHSYFFKMAVFRVSACAALTQTRSTKWLNPIGRCCKKRVSLGRGCAAPFIIKRESYGGQHTLACTHNKQIWLLPGARRESEYIYLACCCVRQIYLSITWEHLSLPKSIFHHQYPSAAGSGNKSDSQ